MIKKIEVPQSSKLSNLKIEQARQYIKFSNNVVELNVVSTLQSNQIDASQLSKFQAGSNITAFAPSCFINCFNLSSVSFKKNLERIGEYSFYGCTRLSSFTQMRKNETGISYIGDYAFARSGITSMSFYMQQYPSQPSYLGSYAFASCYGLKDFKFNYTNKLVEGLFEGCSALESVSLAPNNDGYGKKVFKNCISLNSLTLPPATEYIYEEFAAGCTSLASIKLSEPGNYIYNESFRNDMLNGTPITSLYFPSSVTNLNVFSQNALRGMNHLAEIHFNGMLYNQIANGEVEVQQEDGSQQQPDQGQQIESKYALNIIYCLGSLKDKLMPYLNIRSHFDDMFVMKSSSELIDIMSYAIDAHIPITAIAIKRPDEGPCGNCDDFNSKILDNNDFYAFVKANTKCILLLMDWSTFCCQIKGKTYSIKSITSNEKTYTYVMIAMYWSKADGKNEKNFINGNRGTWDYYKKITDFVGDFSIAGPSSTSTPATTAVSVVDIIANTRCFGLNHNVTIYSKDGKSIEYIDGQSSPDGGGSIAYSVLVPVDNITTNDFRYGQWYGKAMQLRRYADDNYIPTLVIATQGSSYPESKKFNEQIFGNSSFQQYMTSKSMLLCKVDSSSFSGGGDAAYAYKSWMDSESFTKFPILMLYWMKENGSLNIEDGTIAPSIVDSFAYFSSNSSSSKEGEYECVHNINEITAWIENSNILQQYAPNSRFQRPAITSFLQRYPKYKMYSNQNDDDYGRYFPVVKLEKDTLGTKRYLVNVNNANGNPTEYDLSSTSVLPPEGTYQYFSLLSTEQNQKEYNQIYDLSGIIFKVGRQRNMRKVKSFEYDYESKPLNEFFALYHITDSNVASYTSSFFDELYVYDNNGDPTTQIDTSVSEGLPFLYNNECTLSTKTPFSTGSGDASYMKIWLSSEARVDTITDDDGDSYKTLLPGDPQYVISCDMFAVEEGNVQTLWAREFSNK